MIRVEIYDCYQDPTTSVSPLTAAFPNGASGANVPPCVDLASSIDTDM